MRWRRKANGPTAVDIGTQGVEALPDDDPQLGQALFNLVEHHLSQFDLNGDLADLDAAIACRRAAVFGGPGHEHEHASNLSDLSFDLLKRHEVTRDPADVQAAIDTATEAVELAGEEDPDHAEFLNKLGEVYQTRFALYRDRSDLERYVELSERSLQRAPARSRGALLAQLSRAYGYRYGLLGDHRDLDASIETGEEALAHSGLSREQRAHCTANLARSFRSRFQHFGAQDDLHRALQLGRRALRLLPDGHPNIPPQLAALSASYLERYERDRDKADIDTAIELCERALATPGVSDAQRRALLSRIGEFRLARFRKEGDLGDLEAVVEYAEQALDGLDEDDPQWLASAESLAGALLHRYQAGDLGDREPDPRDLTRVIDIMERVLAAPHRDSTDSLRRLQNLAVAYGAAPVEPERLVEVTRRLIAAVGAASSRIPTDLTEALTTIGGLAHRASMPVEAAALWRRAVESLPRCAPLGMAWTDLEHQLSGSGSLVSDAAAAQLAIGDVAGAVELAELGRGIVLSNRLTTGVDLAALARSAPELAARFERLVAELDDLTRVDERQYRIPGAFAVRRQPRGLADRWDRMLDEIREVPGFAGFLGRPRLAELQEAASHGAVVLVNLGRSGADAVLLRRDSVERVPLPGLRRADVDSRVNALAGVEIWSENSVRKARTAPRPGATHDLLSWLWDAITEPVLTALGHVTPPDAGEPVPRVWWVPTGELSLLPLHAAGLPGGPSALDLVVSSYSPTIRALTFARQRPSGGSRTRLTVTMSRTGGLADLPASAAETARLPASIALADDAATAAAVLAALPRATWAHFSCHATSHPEGASKSGLHLHDRTLHVPEISRAGTQNGELAYLSACSTGQGSLFQANEAMHLASAFQLAGYRHVVATLWPVNDRIAAMAARRFYRLLGDAPTAADAASALREVTRRLRARYPDDPELWAPFVHSGP